MKAKIYKVRKNASESEEVVLRIERDESGLDFVKISAWHEDDGGNVLYQESQMDFGDADNNFEMCEQFVADFSEASAQAFYNSFR